MREIIKVKEMEISVFFFNNDQKKRKKMVKEDRENIIIINKINLSIKQKTSIDKIQYIFL